MSVQKVTFGSLFAGIGGFDLGFERSGMACKWQVEINPFCQKVLAKHWPDARRHDDVKTFPPTNSEGWRVDVICGGFPCQDISSANFRGKGIEGARSGLWSEYIRIVRAVQPRYVVIENVAAITFRGLDRVLGDLAKSGFDAEWQTISAQMLGAPHGRERIFIVAYAPGERSNADEVFQGSPFEWASEKQSSRLRVWPGKSQPSPSLPDRIRWVPNGELLRVVDGIPDQLDRYHSLGNAVVPQVAEWIGRRIMTGIRGEGP